ncbi:unnamed protein product, partial [Mycena citricolor]
IRSLITIHNPGFKHSSNVALRCKTATEMVPRLGLNSWKGPGSSRGTRSVQDFPQHTVSPVSHSVVLQVLCSFYSFYLTEIGLYSSTYSINTHVTVHKMQVDFT